MVHAAEDWRIRSGEKESRHGAHVFTNSSGHLRAAGPAAACLLTSDHHIRSQCRPVPNKARAHAIPGNTAATLNQGVVWWMSVEVDRAADAVGVQPTELNLITHD